jgi:hypothetical protein
MGDTVADTGDINNKRDSITMRPKLIYLLLILLVIPQTGCAYDNLPKGEQENQTIIQVTMRLGGAKREDYFYYIVFNLSGDPEKKPRPIFDGEDRGKNWSVYYVWGWPPDHELGIYRGYGGEGVNGGNLIDVFPIEEAFLNELLPGTNANGDQFTLRIDLTDVPLASGIINMNMIVCNQAIDAESQFEYEFDPYVFDSFYNYGISININGTADFWNEVHNPQEDIPNEHEDIAPPEADIIGWHFQIVSR